MMVDIFGELCFTDDGFKSWVTSDDGDTDDNMSSIVKLNWRYDSTVCHCDCVLLLMVKLLGHKWR